jgi:hypothetical protein
MVSYFTNRKIVPDITPDPVFGFNQNIRDQLSKEVILEKFNLPEKYILFSFKNKGIVSLNWLKECQSKLKEIGATGVLLTMPGGVIIKDIGYRLIPPPLSPMEWYALIKYSSGYIGENMHPIVVALHNSIPFFAFDDYGKVKFRYFVDKKCSKIYDILSVAGFIDNYVNTLGSRYICPSPGKVISLIKNFDSGKCKLFSAVQQEKYNKMMENILT